MAGPYSIGSTVWPGLSKVVEECGEVGQVLGKLIGSGGDPNHFDGSDLKTRAEDEIGDLLAALDYFIRRNDLDFGRFMSRRDAKIALFDQWHSEAQPAPAPPARKSVSCSKPWCGGDQLCVHCKTLPPTPTKEG